MLLTHYLLLTHYIQHAVERRERSTAKTKNGNKPGRMARVCSITRAILRVAYS